MAGLLLMRGIGGLLSWMFVILRCIWILLFGVGLLPWLLGFVLLLLVLIFALPLDFHGRLRVVRSMFIPGALHGNEASFLAEAGLRKLRAAIVTVVWSRRQFLANPGAVLCLLDGPTGCDPAFCVVWFRFRMLRRYLAYWLGEVFRVYRLLEHAADGCPGHGPAHLLVESAAEIGFIWSPEMVGWAREGLPVSSNLAGPFSTFGRLF